MAKFKIIDQIEALDKVRNSKTNQTYRQYFNDALNVLENAVSNGSIANPRYMDAKDSLASAFRKAGNQLARELLAARPLMGDLEKTILNELYYGGDSIVDWANRVKKAAKLPKESHEIEAVMRATLLADDAATLRDIIKAAKAVAVKRQPKSEEEKAQIKPKFAPDLDAKAINKVIAILTGIVEDNKGTLQNSLRVEFDQVGVSYTSIAENMRSGAKYEEAMRYAPQSNFGVLAHQYFNRVQKTFDSVAYGEARQKMVDRAYDAISRGFVTKNAAKLAAIIDRKSGVEMSYEIGNIHAIRYLEGRIHFRFGDGSSFTVQNSSVYAVSSHGVPFMRFPLTFHSVVNADGSKMSRPSEERMNKVWN